ncbi:MAG: sigma-70 family RNA polymerase sigma factor [Calditrichaeota bacterium]|nr:sigma-70 family RNA polymerase sigma factor [Calditrichota bacterium]
MKYELIKRDISTNAEFGKLIRRKIDKLDRLLEHFNSDLLFLKINLDRIKKRKRFIVRLVLDVAGRYLRAKKEGADLVGAANEAFDALIREVNKYKEFLRHEPEYRRKTRPNYKERLAAMSLTAGLQEAYEKYAEEIMPRLYNFALKEIRNRIYQGRIKQGDISVGDVLDEAVVRVSENVANAGKFEEKEARRKLYREIIKIINQWIKERGSRLTFLEKRLKPQDIDTEIYEYYQPDEIVYVEDVIPDNAETPEEEVEAEEMQKVIDRVISMMPDQWRQAFTLIELDQFSPEEVAMIQDRTTDEVERELESARGFIKEKLADFGFEWLES